MRETLAFFGKSVQQSLELPMQTVRLKIPRDPIQTTKSSSKSRGGRGRAGFTPSESELRCSATAPRKKNEAW